MSGIANITTAREAWKPLPDWIAALAAACDQSTQAQVARDLGRSGALVNQVLRKSYKGDMARVEEVVRGALMNSQVTCPALGPLPQNECVDWRLKAKGFQSGNPMRTRMYRACHRCPRYLGEQT